MFHDVLRHFYCRFFFNDVAKVHGYSQGGCFLSLTANFRKGNVTHTVIVAPLAPGVFNISWAQLTYKSVDSDDRQVCMK